MKVRTKAATIAATTLMIGGLTTAASQPASATAADCHAGLVDAATAWGQCRATVGNSWGGFQLIVTCYNSPQQTAYGLVPNTITASCPNGSYVTGIYMNPAP